MTILQAINNPLLVLAAGAVGSALRLTTAKIGSLSMPQRVGHVVVGSLTSIFVAPAIVEIKFPGASAAVQSAVAFATGLGAPYAAERLIRWLETGSSTKTDEDNHA